MGGTYWLHCDDPDDNQAYVALVTWDPQNPFGPLAAADRAADAARNAVVLLDPDIGTSPAAAGPQLVGLPTWLWVTEAWTPRSASATLGGVTAQVTATPATITWNPGDGTPAFTCAGPGPAWDDHHPDRTSPCTHTYQDRSTTTDRNGTFALTATITYAVRWQATNGDAGELEPVTRSTTIRLLVREAQAVIEHASQSSTESPESPPGTAGPAPELLRSPVVGQPSPRRHARTSGTSAASRQASSATGAVPVSARQSTRGTSAQSFSNA